MIPIVARRNASGVLTLACAVLCGIAAAAPRSLPASGNVPAGSAAPGLSDTARYRTFIPDSLLDVRPVRRLNVGTGWSATFVNTTGEVVSDLTITFPEPVRITFFNPFPDVLQADDGRIWVVSGQSLAPGDRVTIHGTGPVKGTRVTEWHFGNAPSNPGFLPPDQHLLLPMPNGANLRSEVFAQGGFAPGATESDRIGGMVVGKSFLRYVNFHWRIDPDSSRLHGWVRLRRPGDLLRSLYNRRLNLMHNGTPRGFCGYDNGRPFLRQVNNLTPLKQNNRLFADLAVLKVNIAASQLGMTPPGLGELLYNEPGNPLSSLMVREISQVGDSMLTYCGVWPPEMYVMVDSVIQKINGAFSGPIDTVAFGDSLVLSGVRPLSAVPFLTENTLVPPLRTPRTAMQEAVDDEEEIDGEEAVPEMIQVAQNFPNPFNPSTAIQFELHEAATVTIRVYDLLGREVQTLLDREPLFDGTNEVMFDASGMASGVYLYRIMAESAEGQARSSVFTGKMILVR